MNLMQVLPDRALHWPEDLSGPAQRYRGGEGYVVDLDAPFEAEWCAGQLHKLTAAPAGAKPSEITLRAALGLITERDRKDAKDAKAGAKSAAASKPIASDLPSVDIPKKAPVKV